MKNTFVEVDAIVVIPVKVRIQLTIHADDRANIDNIIKKHLKPPAASPKKKGQAVAEVQEIDTEIIAIGGEAVTSDPFGYDEAINMTVEGLIESGEAKYLKHQIVETL